MSEIPKRPKVPRIKCIVAQDPWYGHAVIRMHHESGVARLAVDTLKNVLLSLEANNIEGVFLEKSNIEEAIAEIEASGWQP